MTEIVKDTCKYCVEDLEKNTAHHCYPEYVMRLGMLERHGQQVHAIKESLRKEQPAHSEEEQILDFAIDGLLHMGGDANAKEMIERSNRAIALADAVILRNTLGGDEINTIFEEARLQYVKYKVTMDVPVFKPAKLTREFIACKQLLAQAGESSSFVPGDEKDMLRRVTARLERLLIAVGKFIGTINPEQV
jgi:hypothetical protein